MWHSHVLVAEQLRLLLLLTSSILVHVAGDSLVGDILY